MIDCSDCVSSQGLPAACCQDVTIKIAAPEDLEGWSEVRWMAAHESVSVARERDTGEWVTIFQTPCVKLTPEGRCSIYDTRPKICSDYSAKTCIINGDGDLYDLHFYTMEEVDAYIAKEVIQTLKADIGKQVFDAQKYAKDIIRTRDQINIWPFKRKNT